MKPNIPQKEPYRLTLKPGTYLWCACGKSQNQPFCDGSHKDTQFTPIKFTVDESKKLPLCGCKQSNKGHLCDGSHREL